MKESSSSEPVELDLTTVGLQPVVAFMYTGSLELVNVAAALHVIAVADYLMMENVKTASAQYLMAEMNPTNALQLFKDVALYSQEVADKTSTYIDVRFEEISASNDWNTLTPGEIQYWLGRDTLLVRNEDQVFEALQNWTNFDTKARTKSFKTLMLDGTIRMPYISNERLAKIRKHKLCKSIAKDLDTEAWRRMAAGGFEAACVGLDVLPRSHLFPREPVCPITRKPFRVAVVAPCGHRFEEHAFREYCKTMRALPNASKPCPMIGCRRKYCAVKRDEEFQNKCDVLRAKHESMADSMVHFDAAVADVPEEKEDGIAVERLRAGLKDWHKDPLVEFFVTPQTDWKIWKVGIPGKNGTPWEGGLYKATITFTADFPFKPPSLKFTPVIFHPNVYQSGRCYVHSMLR